MVYNIFDFSHFWSNLKTLLSNKVDKVSGMGLSQNSFTNAEKTKLASLENYDDTEVKAGLKSVTDEVMEARGTYADLNERISEIAVANKPVLSKTTAEWNYLVDLVTDKDVIYVYTDYMTTSSGVEIAALKVGDGVTRLIDMPFVASGTITEAERDFWNNKVTAYMDIDDAETLIITKS